MIPEPLSIDAAVILDSEGLVARDARVVLSGDRIRSVRPRTDSDEPAPLGSPESVVVPGFVNAHQHGQPANTAHFGIPDAPLEIWLVWLGTLPIVPLGPATRAAAQRLANGGVTTTVHFHTTRSRTADDLDVELRTVASEYDRVGIRAVVACDLRDRGVPVYGDADRFLATVSRELEPELIPAPAPVPLHYQAVVDVVEDLSRAARAGDLGLAAVGYGPAGPPWCSDELLRAVARSSQRNSIPIQTHLHETSTERAHGIVEYGESSVVHLDRLGILGPLTSLAHCVWMDDGDISRVAASGATIVTNPSSNLRLHAGTAPVRRFLDRGIRVGIGTDSNRLSDDEDMLAEARLARALHRSPDVMDRGIAATRLLAMLTHDPVASVGIETSGRIKAGQTADLVVLAPPRRVVQDPSMTVESMFELADRTKIEAVLCNGAPLSRHEPDLKDITDISSPGSASREQIQALIPHLERHYQELRDAADQVRRNSS